MRVLGARHQPVGLCPVQKDLSFGSLNWSISYHDDMKDATVGIRSFHGMIRLIVARFRPKCVSTSLKSLPTLRGTHRDLYTSSADYDFNVQNTSLLRIVRNRASEYSNLRSEVSTASVGQYMLPLNAQAIAIWKLFPERRRCTRPTAEGAGTFGRSLGGMEPCSEGGSAVFHPYGN